MSLSELSRTLWRERELLELLASKLEEEQPLRAAGRARWLTVAVQEVDAVLAEIRRSELDRAVAVDAVASSLGLPADISLRQLVDSAPAPWDTTLRTHLRALRCLSNDVLELASKREEVSRAGVRAARDPSLSRGAPGPATGTSSGDDAFGEPAGVSLRNRRAVLRTVVAGSQTEVGATGPEPSGDDEEPTSSAALVGLPGRLRGESAHVGGVTDPDDARVERDRPTERVPASTGDIGRRRRAEARTPEAGARLRALTGCRDDTESIDVPRSTAEVRAPTADEAALRPAARLVPPSLLDFLRQDRSG